LNEIANSIFIAAPADVIYRFASDTPRWPEILPHYRYVRVRERNGSSLTIDMSAWRDALPIRWTARQTNDPATPHIAFHHVRGWTRGMDVEWIFTPENGGTRVEIVHRLAFAFPVFADWIGKHVVGGFFIHDVANKTLARMKTLAEAAVA
jgi:ribosome-associated toxin RatA of RatAB toxin-antitoxin module